MGIKIITRTAAVFAAVAVLAGGCAAGKTGAVGELPGIDDGKKLVVCTSHKEEVYEPIIREFEDRTGIWVDVRQGGTKTMLEMIRNDYEAGVYDVMFGGGVETLNSYKEYFEPYEASQADKLQVNLRSADNSWTAFTELPIVFIYNTKIVSEEEAPKSWEELFDEKWRGKISFASPLNSGTSYTILSALIQMATQKNAAEGKEADGQGITEQEILYKFYRQLSGEQAAGSGQVLEEITNGSKSIGITLEETAIRRIAEGESIAMIYPKDWIVAVPDGCAIVKNAPNPENAKLFVDFIISRDVQNYMVAESYRRTVREDIENPDYFPVIEPADFDIVKSGEDEERILELWMDIEGSEQEIGG